MASLLRTMHDLRDRGWRASDALPARANNLGGTKLGGKSERDGHHRRVEGRGMVVQGVGPMHRHGHRLRRAVLVGIVKT